MSDLPTLESQRFHNGMAASPAEAFRTWQQVAGVFFDVALDPPDAAGSFAVDMESFDLGGFVISRIAASAQHFRRSPSTIARTGFDHYLVQLYRRGGYVGTVDDRRIEVTPGDTCILDMGRTLQTVAQDFENITLVLPRAALAPLTRAPEVLHGIVLRGSTPQGALVGKHLEVLYEQAGYMTVAEASRLQQATTMLVAACAAPEIDARQDPGGPSHAPSIMLIRRHIETHLASDQLTSANLCATFGLSRATLYRLFDYYGGVTRYVRDRRLDRCFKEITAASTDKRRIAEIAYDWGFRNESAFSRLFRVTFGMSPREARRVRNVVNDTDEAKNEPMTTRWIRRL